MSKNALAQKFVEQKLRFRFVNKGIRIDYENLKGTMQSFRNARITL